MNSAVGARAEAESVRALSNPDPKTYVSPSYVRWLYNTLGYRPAAVDRNVIGIAGYGGEYPSPKDLRLFMTEFRTDGEDATFSVVQVQGGGNDPDTPGDEACFDTQYTGAITYPTTNVFYSTGGAQDTIDPFSYFVTYMLTKETRIPQTITTSYGGPEYTVPFDYATRVCRLFAELGFCGVSTLFASGDAGVGPGDCLIEVKGHVSVHFIPEFPATCPYLTSVGGTTRHNPEVAASISGGGFSNYFERPPYQANAVPPFLQTLGNKYQGYYHPGGHGVPDISSQALDAFFVRGGILKEESGTSASTPALSASSTADCCKTDGFTAIAGWDPVTGLGTPDFTKMEEIIDEYLKYNKPAAHRDSLMASISYLLQWATGCVGEPERLRESPRVSIWGIASLSLQFRDARRGTAPGSAGVRTARNPVQTDVYRIALESVQHAQEKVVAIWQWFKFNRTVQGRLVDLNAYLGHKSIRGARNSGFSKFLKLENQF
ncbi:peptidase S8/S53 domain-containing protein [Lactarius pseudohatsudake]|nr:peptidase S8/S53 domain-containing protein [Lactarius pseudohatsudake]